LTLLTVILDIPMKVYGPRILARLFDLKSTSVQHMPNVHADMFSLLVEEWRLGGDSISGYEWLLATYVQLSLTATKSRAALEEVFRDVMKTLPAAVFQAGMNLLGDFIAHHGQDDKTVTTTVAVAEQALQNAPEGTTKASQDFVGHCLQVFVNDPLVWIMQPATRLATLNLLLTHSSNRVCLH
jgi:hypothetical protein